MRLHPASLLTFVVCLATVVKAADELLQQEQTQEQQQPKDDPTDSNNQQSFQIPPMEPTPEQIAMVREGARQILSQVPAQIVEPLFETMDGYCKAFESICTLVCAERQSSTTSVSGKEGELSMGCADISVPSVALAQASCICAGYDFTDRVNFAM